MKRILHRYIGDKAFYLMAISVVLPIIIQNGITNFVSLLDNLMVGQVGTDPMSGVSIVNQLMFVFNLCVFGGVSGPGIFTAQYHGSGNQQGIRYTFRLKMMIAAFLSVGCILLFAVWGEPLVRLYLHEGEASSGDLEATLGYAMDYLAVMIWGLVPFAVTSVYAGTLRETGQTLLPMKAGVTAVFVNLILNYILIFGHFGAPKLGVVGAAVATVVSRYVEMAIVVVWAHRHTKEHPFFHHAYGGVPVRLGLQIFWRGFPLLLNEALWSSGMALLNQCYSIRGLDVVAGLNIASTVTNLFSVMVLSFGTAVSIIIGRLLGAGDMEEAKKNFRWLLAFALGVSVCVGVLMASCAHLFPLLYNTSDSVRQLAATFILITACCMPMHAFLNSTYFAMRSGGKTIITFFFDCGFTYVCPVPVAFVLSRFTALPIVPMYIVVQSLDFIKCVVGAILIKRGTWLNNMVGEKEDAPIEIASEKA